MTLERLYVFENNLERPTKIFNKIDINSDLKMLSDILVFPIPIQFESLEHFMALCRARLGQFERVKLCRARFLQFERVKLCRARLRQFERVKLGTFFAGHLCYNLKE